jgi:hypothetical protein
MPAALAPLPDLVTNDDRCAKRFVSASCSLCRSGSAARTIIAGFVTQLCAAPCHHSCEAAGRGTRTGRESVADVRYAPRNPRLYTHMAARPRGRGRSSHPKSGLTREIASAHASGPRVPLCRTTRKPPTGLADLSRHRQTPPHSSDCARQDVCGGAAIACNPVREPPRGSVAGGFTRTLGRGADD